jgi:predicted CopG family antitoxin
MKTTAVRDAVYEVLKRLKGEDEELSDVVERPVTTSKGTDLSAFFGVLKDSDVLKSLAEDTRRHGNLQYFGYDTPSVS